MAAFAASWTARRGFASNRKTEQTCSEPAGIWRKPAYPNADPSTDARADAVGRNDLAEHVRSATEMEQGVPNATDLATLRGARAAYGAKWPAGHGLCLSEPTERAADRCTARAQCGRTVRSSHRRLRCRSCFGLREYREGCRILQCRPFGELMARSRRSSAAPSERGRR